MTVSQPYASLIADGLKWVENRTWGTQYRGWLAIHAGKTSRYLDRLALSGYPTGVVVAVANLVSCINIAGPRRMDRATVLADGVTVDDVLTHEHTEGPWCWVLRDVRALREPLGCRGAQGLWDVSAELFETLRERFRNERTGKDGGDV